MDKKIETEKVQACIADLYETYPQHPLMDRDTMILAEAERICTVEVKSFDGYLVLSSIAGYPRGSGAGSEGLKRLCALADKHEIRINLSVCPFGRDGLKKRQLCAWYKRHGFRAVRGVGYVRTPHAAYTPAPPAKAEVHPHGGLVAA